MATDMVTNGSDVAGKVKVVLGAQWGDEGKGKLVDLLAEHADVVARCQVINRFSPNFSHFIHIVLDSTNKTAIIKFRWFFGEV